MFTYSLHLRIYGLQKIRSLESQVKARLEKEINSLGGNRFIKPSPTLTLFGHIFRILGINAISLTPDIIIEVRLNNDWLSSGEPFSPALSDYEYCNLVYRIRGVIESGENKLETENFKTGHPEQPIINLVKKFGQSLRIQIGQSRLAY